jgi:hypothetical protein
MDNELMDYAEELFDIVGKALEKDIRISDDLLNIIVEMKESESRNKKDDLFNDLSLESAIFLKKLLEGPAHSYKMSESTDPDFIYFLLDLEQHIEDNQ